MSISTIVWCLYVLSVLIFWWGALPTKFTEKQGFNGWLGENVLFAVALLFWPIILAVVFVLGICQKKI
jgi:hypothetical protein